MSQRLNLPVLYIAYNYICNIILDTYYDWKSVFYLNTSSVFEFSYYGEAPKEVIFPLDNRMPQTKNKQNKNFTKSCGWRVPANLADPATLRA